MRLMMIGISVTLVFVAGLVGYWGLEQSRGWQAARSELAAVGQKMGERENELAALQSETAKLKARVADEQERLNQLRRKSESAEAAQQRLENEMRSALESREVTISRLQDKLTVNILDRVMFDSGHAELKPDGQQVLSKVAEILQQFPDKQILVVGHTDNIPISAAKFRFATNWELSVARATAAVRYLSETAGVNPSSLGALGYGEWHPIADNSTPEGRAKNRRIAIVILAKDTLPTDVEPGTEESAISESK